MSREPALPKGYKRENHQDSYNPTRKDKIVVGIILGIGTLLAVLAGIVTRNGDMISLVGGVAIVAGLAIYFVLFGNNRSVTV